MHYTIHRAGVQRHAAELLRTCLALKDYSPTCTALLVLHVLFTACSRLCSLSCSLLVPGHRPQPLDRPQGHPQGPEV